MAVLNKDNTVIAQNVLAVYSEYVSYFDDGYWGQFAIYWDGSKFNHIDVTDNKVEIDADEYLYQKYRDEVFARFYDRRLIEAQNEAARLEKGCIAKVVRGRKIPKGLQGKVIAFTTRESQWGVQHKVGLATSDVMVEVERNGRKFQNHRDVTWVDTKNVDRAVPADINLEEVKQCAEFDTKQAMRSKGFTVV